MDAKPATPAAASVDDVSAAAGAPDIEAAAGGEPPFTPDADDPRAASPPQTPPEPPRPPTEGFPPADENLLCVCCWEEPPDTKLEPCGHDQICSTCARLVRRCPLCRAAIQCTITNGDRTSRLVQRIDRDGQPRALQAADDDWFDDGAVLSGAEKHNIAVGAFVFWLFLFFGGKSEWMYGVRETARSGCDARCEDCWWRRGGSQYRGGGGYGCTTCKEGYINSGMKCYASVTDLPPVVTAASLGGGTYFALIIMAQAAGISCEIGLIRRLRARGLMPTREIGVLVIAMSIEILRMFLVDTYMLAAYLLPDGAFSVYQVPVADTNSSAVQEPTYFLATHAGAWNNQTCTAWSLDSPLLDYSTDHGWYHGGDPRFRHTGWVVGGEFCLYYLLATVLNEVADVFFVVPTRSGNYGWKCKVLSIVLEIFQLGTLYPAAAFQRNDGCLQFLNPLFVDLFLIRDTIVAFGYAIWSSVFVIGLAASMGVFVHLMILSALKCVIGPLARFERLSALLHRAILPCLRLQDLIEESFCAAAGVLFKLYFYLASVPLFIAGSWLGVLVIASQSSKTGGISVITAVVLLFDVLFKVMATIICEGVECISLSAVEGAESITSADAVHPGRGAPAALELQDAEGASIDDEHDPRMEAQRVRIDQGGSSLARIHAGRAAPGVVATELNAVAGDSAEETRPGEATVAVAVEDDV